MSKQYLTVNTIEDAHKTDIFSLAVTPTQILSGSGSSSIKIHSTTSFPDFPLTQTLSNAHKLGCHHLVTSKNSRKAASVGFDGEVRIWKFQDDEKGGEWVDDGSVEGTIEQVGDVWALALSEDGRFLASTTYDGRINVWDVSTPNAREKIRRYETKGSFGLCLDLSIDGRFTASGHENGGVYIFNNDSSKMLHSLPGLIKPVRAISFSPGSKLLTAAGDSKIIALYDVQSGDQVANLTGHTMSILSLDWNHTGEYLLSGAFDGKIKIWSVETRTCVATHTETNNKPLWSVKWLPKIGRSEAFAVAGAGRAISFYREATGG